MRGYQSIPSSLIDTVENGVPPSISSDGSSPSTTTPSPWIISSRVSVPFVASKLGYIALGIIIGCISSRGSLRWGPAADNTNDMLGASSTSFMLSKTVQKSFVDSLPFEQTNPLSSWNPAQPCSDPLSWNPAQPKPHEEKTPTRHFVTNSMSNSAISATKEETSLLSATASILGTTTSSSSSSSTTSPPPTPHLLYHAHISSFGLLYDSTKSSNSYLGEYSLDYFLINSGGFDAQINQAYCAVATVATILNSLKYAKRFRDGGDLSGWSFDLPIDPRYDPYPYATQQDILTGDCVWNTVIEHGDGSGSDSGHVDGIFKPPYGLSLEQAGKLLKCHVTDEWEVTVQQVDPSQITLGKMRYDIKAALIDPDARVMINYDRKGLGQVG